MGRDKFAAMARAAESTEPSAVPHVAANPPRRDKMAALAASQATTTSSASGGSRGNSKLAAMAAASGAAVAPEATSSDGLKTLHAAKLKSRMSKRRQILENLDRAEDLTCKLLELVHKTTTALQDLSSNSSDLPHLSREYRKTLNEIHPLLSTGAEDLVRPYKNHSTETNQSMYAARVEMRLAKERTDVIKVLTELEQEQPASGQFESLSSSPAVGTTTNKRPREE